MQHGIPFKCTGIIADVFLFIDLSIFRGSIFIVWSTSTNTGLQPELIIAFAVATNEFDTVILDDDFNLACEETKAVITNFINS